MEIVADRLDWTQFDEENWRKFLDTDSGKRLIPKVLEAVPMLLPAGETNAILIRSGEHRGLQLAVSRLLELSHSTPETKTEVATAYPALDDDTAWNDGQNLAEVTQTTKPNPDII